MRTLLISFFTFVSLTAFSQDKVKRYTWDETPKFKEIPEEFKKYPAVVLKDYRLYDNRIGEYTFKAFVVKHVAIKIQTAEGISSFNTVSIDRQYVRDYRDIQARVIKPDGRIEVLSEKRIIEKNDSNGRQFAFEGVEVGDIIEYYYVIKDSPDFSGVEYFQRRIPVLDAKFQINDISQGVTSVDGYNGMEKSNLTSHQVCAGTNLPAYKEEINATNFANLAKVYFRVSNSESFGWKGFYRGINQYAAGTNAKSMVKDFIKRVGLDDTAVPLDERLKKMDIAIKENLELDRSQKDYSTIFEKKKITTTMALYLYKDIFDYLKIPYQFVASTDRFEDHFDANRAVPGMLSELMIYIPETKKYISPFNYWLPYGPPTSAAVNNDAVSFTAVKKNLDYNFTKIGGVTMEDNTTVSDNEITIGDDMETVSVKKKKSYLGYLGYTIRYNLKSIPEDKVKEFLKSFDYQDVDVDIKNYSFDNKEYHFNYDREKPVTLNTEVLVKESWIENAGSNYVVTIGKVLGKQTNLYQETERINAIDLYYPKKYVHHIIFNIPKGYTVKNVNSVLFRKELKNENGEVIGLFDSKGNVENGKVQINIEEFYNFTHLEKNRYNEYRDLINAAYDFYKSSIVLSKV